MAPASEQHAAKAAAVREEEEGPHESQFFSPQKRSNSIPWRKALVYDCKTQAVKVRKEKDISQSSPWHPMQILIRSPISDKGECLVVKLPPKEKHITIFFDETESEATTSETNPKNEERNIIITTLYLDRLSKSHQILHLFRQLQLSTMYVMNIAS